ncbi:MAG: amidohydrolase family protein [Streptosporangiales bacterium]|nr:amidohydrolase family protein [Streptosporangiales bacterium]MBO0891681.1 amidohydrolase family protein [Acidothermales bacterium]
MSVTGPPIAAVRPRGLAVRGRLWPGGGDPALDDAVVVVGADGLVSAYGPADGVHLPDGVHAIDGAWVGPGVADAHAHLAFGSAPAMLAGGVLAVRDLGAPLDDALAVRDPHGIPAVVASGPILTAPGGYPSRSWGARGFARFLGSAAEAHRAVVRLADAGVDVVKLALEPADGLPVPPLEVARAVVEAAHDNGLTVTCHAFTAEMVARAVDAGVDELAHVPTERLPTHLVAQLVLDDVVVVSTMHALVANGDAEAADAVRANARALVGSGVPVVYGTDLGNTGIAPGVDAEELALLAEAGLGPEGALRAATEGSAAVGGLNGVHQGRVRVGERARMVVLAGDPVAEPKNWSTPVAVVHGTEVTQP